MRMENKMQKAVIDADFFIKLTEYASDNGKIFCQVMDDLGVQPIMHRYVAEVELKRAESLKKLIDEGKITIIDYDEYIDRNDDENYKYYFQCAYERMNSFEIKVHIWHRINFWIENSFRFGVSPLYHFMPSDRIFLWTE